MKEICSTTKYPKTCKSKTSADENCKKHSERSPPSQQRRIYKRYFLCMSYVEISQSEGCTISAVYNSIHRSLKKLKKNYDL